MASTRTTCSTCGLPHYGTATDDCPYCTRAGSETGDAGDESADRSRDACESCALPYYTDENESCPYCGHVPGEAIAASDADDSPADWESPRPESGGSRPRDSCVACGLEYYTDTNDDCPYCGHDQRVASTTASADDGGDHAETTGTADAASTTGSPAETVDHAGTAESRVDESESPGLLTRIRRAIGL